MAGVNDNLIPAKKGEVRNPKGKPKGTKNFKTIIEEFLSVETDAMNPMSGKLEKLSVGQQIVIALLTKAKKGDVSAIKELLDRIDGKAKIELKHSGEVSTGAKEVAQLLQKLIQDDTETKDSDTDGS